MKASQFILKWWQVILALLVSVAIIFAVWQSQKKLKHIEKTLKKEIINHQP